MALPDWILGVILRPGETFVRARTEMKLSYWWILISVFTIESVLLVNDPRLHGLLPTPSSGAIVFNWATFLLLLFMVQSLSLLAAGRLMGWAITLAEARIYTGLIWVLVLVEDLVVFYPYLMQWDKALFWIQLPFIAWRIAAQTVGVMRVTGSSPRRALTIVLIATLPWQLPLLYLSWAGTFQQTM